MVEGFVLPSPLTAQLYVTLSMATSPLSTPKNIPFPPPCHFFLSQFIQHVAMQWGALKDLSWNSHCLSLLSLFLWAIETDAPKNKLLFCKQLIVMFSHS